MNDERTSAGTRRQEDETGAARRSERATGATMRARRWAIAYQYREPADYDIPVCPEWTVRRPERGGLSLAEDDEAAPFISADHPVRVRR